MKPKVYIAGIDGYLGWSLAVYLVANGYTVGGCDTGARRCWVKKQGSHSAIPILPINERLEAVKEYYHVLIPFDITNVTQYQDIAESLNNFKPDAIVHFAECPSAPYSMKSVAEAVNVQQNNIIGTLNILFAIKDLCPGAHLIKLGTMGEYGTPNCDIPEGTFEMEYNGRKTECLFPRKPGSFYHASKVNDTVNVEMACRMWGLCSTDIMQGVVYGTRLKEMLGQPELATRFDFDQCFGTLINRYCAQLVVNHPLTAYGTGQQLRGFLPLKDSMQCIKLAIDNPPARGEYRTWNQFEEVYSVMGLAELVKEVGYQAGYEAKIFNIENPRVEESRHYYNPVHEKLPKLGYKPSGNIKYEISEMLFDLIPHKQRILDKKEVLMPSIRWDGTDQTCRQFVMRNE